VESNQFTYMMFQIPLCFVNFDEPAAVRNSIPNTTKYINIIVAIIRYMKY